MRKKEIEKRIQEIKSELMKTEEMRPGSLTKQSKGSKGKYYQLSYTQVFSEPEKIIHNTLCF